MTVRRGRTIQDALPGRKASPLRPVLFSTTPDGRVHHWQATEVRNGLPWKPYERHRSAFGGTPAPADVERVCRWRRSLIAAVIVLEMAAEGQGSDRAVAVDSRREVPIVRPEMAATTGQETAKRP